MFLCWIPPAVQTVIIMACKGREWAMKSISNLTFQAVFSVPWYLLLLMCKKCNYQTLDPLNFRFSRLLLVCYKSLTPSVISSFDFKPVNKWITWFWNFRNNFADNKLKTGLLKVAMAHEWRVQHGSFGTETGILGSSSWAIFKYGIFLIIQSNGMEGSIKNQTTQTIQNYCIYFQLAHCNIN